MERGDIKGCPMTTKRNQMQEHKQFKNSPEVRAYMAKIKRDYRARQKQKVGIVELS